MNRIPVSEAWPVLVAAGILLIAQGTWLFIDARGRGGKAWFWGLWGFIQFPWPTVTYLILLQLKKRRNAKRSD